MKVIDTPPRTLARKRSRYPNKLIFASSLLLVLVGGVLLFQDSIVIKGIPLSLIFKGLVDIPTLEAYVSGDKQALHARLEKLGFEDQIKAYYRPKIRDEVKLDRHIHQIFYETTGYVGKAYYVNSQGTLSLRGPVDTQFPRWFDLASQAGVVVDHFKEGDTIYVISPGGAIAPYKDIAKVYPPALLNRLIQVKRQSQPNPNSITTDGTGNSPSIVSPSPLSNP
ncbi:MAG: hypothetical protein KME17_09200 [Cyanosarcina radialis HA8281-LM2]|jgi:hypothetical protein|nr:hypothetical protein [Cyanosarcina radialis HA8281-LM2]